MENKFLISSFLFIGVLALLGTASAYTPEKIVSPSTLEQNYPSADGSSVVWSQGSGSQKIYYKDLNTNSPAKLVHGSYENIYPDVSDKYVVWENGVVDGKIYYKNIKTTNPASPVYSNGNNQYYPKISGNNVVWEESKGTGLNIRYSIQGYNLSTHEHFTVVQKDEYEFLPILGDIDNNYVVYIINHGVKGDIKLYNTITHTTKTVKFNSDIFREVAISNDNLIWIERIGSTKVIKKYKISTGITSTVLTNLTGVSNIVLYNNFAVWQKFKYDRGYDNPYYDIQMTDISKTNPITNVCTNLENQEYPKIGGSYKTGVYVTWEDFRSGKGTLYWRNMDPLPPWIKATYPTQGYTRFSRTANIIIKFNKYISPSINYNKISVKNLSNNKYVPITKSIKNDILYIKTNNKRLAHTKYQITIPAKSVKDNALNRLATTKNIIFRTGP